MVQMSFSRFPIGWFFWGTNPSFSRVYLLFFGVWWAYIFWTFFWFKMPCLEVVTEDSGCFMFCWATGPVTLSKNFQLTSLLLHPTALWDLCFSCWWGFLYANGIFPTVTLGWKYIHVSGQISSRPHMSFHPKWCFSKEIPLFQGNLGWWNIIIWPDFCTVHTRPWIVAQWVKIDGMICNSYEASANIQWMYPMYGIFFYCS